MEYFPGDKVKLTSDIIPHEKNNTLIVTDYATEKNDKVKVKSQITGNEYRVYQDEISKINESKNIIKEIKESILIGRVLLEKGDKIKILTESITFDDIIDIFNQNKSSKEVIGLVNYIAKNRDKYQGEIKDFTDWFLDAADESDLENIDRIIKKNDPSETFDNLPSNSWSFYKAYA